MCISGSLGMDMSFMEVGSREEGTGRVCESEEPRCENCQYWIATESFRGSWKLLKVVPLRKDWAEEVVLRMKTKDNG